MARITLWNDYKEHNEIINIELGKLSNQSIEQNKPTWDKAGNSVQISQDYNGVKIDSSKGIEVVSSKNSLLLNASKGIELKRKDNGEILFGADANGDLIVKGTINMVGGSILWDKVTAPDYSKIKGGPPTDATNTWSDLTGDDRIKGIFFTKDGKLAIKADAISIGSSTVYENGYDPTKINVGTRNYVVNSDFRDYYEDPNGTIGWDKAKNGYIFPNQGWSNGFNPGVPSPEIGYHAHLNIEKFGFPVLEFINRNSDINQTNRWLGMNQYFSTKRMSEIGFALGREYTISFEAMSDTVGFYVSAGFHHKYTTATGTGSGFRDYIENKTIQTANVWEKFSVTFTIDDKVLLDQDAFIYLYGANSASAPEGSAWMRNIQLEDGNKATAWNLAPEDQDKQAKNASNRNDITRVRYIRDYLKGSTANGASHWVAIKAFRDGIDVAQGRPVTSNRPSNDAGRPLSRVTDGNTDSNLWASVPSTTASDAEWVQVDLGQVYEDIDYVQVWHYYSDSRSYYKTKIEVSENGKNWTVLYDSAVSGTYRETPKGFIAPVNPGRYFQSVETQFKVVDGKISSKVENTTYTNDKTAMDKRVTSVEQTAKGIDVILKQEGTNKVVDGRAIIGQINLTPSDAKIRFENIQLDGKVTFNSFDSSTQNKINDINLSSELAQVKPDILQGKTLYNDPTFEYGVNGILPYNNLSNGNVVVARIQNESTSPTTSTGMLSIKTNGPASPNLGGFTFSTMTRANATFITRIIARIPVGYKILWGSNATGTGASNKWLTSTEGTGQWQEYVHKLTCGTSGSFSTTSFFHIYHPSATTVTWHVAYATVIDATNVNNSISDIITGGPNLVSGTTFSKPDGWLPWSGRGAVGVYEAFGPAAPCVYVSTKVDGVNTTLAAGTTVGLENAGRTFPVRAGKQYTVSAEIATSEFGDTLDYMYLMHKQISAGNMRLPNIKVTDFPRTVPISVGSGTYYYKVEFTFVADVDDDNASILFCGTTRRDLPGANNVGYAWIRIAKLKVEEGNKASPWSLSPSDVADTIVVGGNNLIPDSLFKQAGKWRNWGAGSGSRLLNQKVDLAGFDTGFTFAASTTGEFGYAMDLVPVTKDETYTLSAWFKLDKPGIVKVQEGDTTVKWTSTNISPPINKWVRITHTFVAKGSTTSLYFGQDNTGNSTTAGYVTGAQLERGNKATDWTQSQLDTNESISGAEQNAKDYTNVISSNESSHINRNYNFADWTGQLPNYYKGLTGPVPSKVASTSGNGNSVRFVSTAGTENYFHTDGKDSPLFDYYYVETTFKLESGSAAGSGILFRHFGPSDKILHDKYVKIKDFVANPIIGKWYTISTVFKVPPLAGFSYYRIYTMGSFGPMDSTKPACSILFDSVISRAATEQEAKSYESDILLQNKKGSWDNATTLVNSWKGAAVNGKTTINGGLLETNTVTAEHIAIGDFSNLSQADEMTNTAYNTTLIGTTKYFKIGPQKYSPLQLNKLNNKDFKVGDELYFSCFGYKEGNFTVTLVLRYYYKGSWVNAGTAIIGFNTSLGPAECTLKITQDIDTSKELISINLFMEKDGSTDVGHYYLRNIEVRRKNNGRMIIDGSIDANHVKANAITATHIKTGTITANEISGNTITAAEINMSNLTANTAFINAIKATSISADKISGGTISGVTINVTTDAYVGNKLQIGSHTSAAYKEISFNGVSRISNQGSNGEIVKISAMHTNINDGHVGLGGLNYRVSVSGEFDLSNVQRFIGGIPAVFA